MCEEERERERQQWENGSVVVEVVEVVEGRRCKQTVGKKATSYIIEGDVKASSLQGCQCQEAEPGWEQRAPPCLPLQWAAIYIVNTHAHTHTHTHTLSLFVSLSVSHSVSSSLFLCLSHTFSLSLSLSPSQHVCLALSPVIRGSEGLRGETRAQIKIKDRRTMQKMENRLILKESQITVKEEDKAVLCVCVCVCVRARPYLWWLMVLGSQARSDWSL